MNQSEVRSNTTSSGDAAGMVQILFGKEYCRRARPGSTGLGTGEVKRCQLAIKRWRQDPRTRGLNFERLGSGEKQNHWSIRASQELRVILAVEFDIDKPKRAAVANIGHHDEVYEWARRRGYYTDLADSSVVIQPENPAVSQRAENDSGTVPPVAFDEWMLFLSKRQERLVFRHHRGAARIRGAAGTGKTVVALHRAAELGRRYRGHRILVTTFSRSLCVHMNSLFRRLPEPPDNVDIVNIDKLAYDILGDTAGRIDMAEANEAFAAAFEQTVPAALAARVGEEYLREEICRVIKGRDAGREEYLDTGRFERLGRIQSFKKADREICWNLREAWDREMERRGIVGFEDRLIRARDRVWERDNPKYRSAIIDEGQDMTLVGMQLVRGLVAGQRTSKLQVDGMLVLDDSAQRIYPGGFKPSWADLDYTGYSDIIRVNYRNSRAIFEKARSVRGEVIVARDDSDDGAASDVEFEREEGVRPKLSIVHEGEAPEVLRVIRKLVSTDSYSREEIAVLAQHNKDADDLQRFLTRKGIQCVNLSELRSGPLGNGVRLGTFDRAKGLEFRAVLLVRLGKSQFPLQEPTQAANQGLADEDSESACSSKDKEERQLHLDRLYAAMTRARDQLFLIANEEPCDEIARAFGRIGRERQALRA